MRHCRAWFACFAIHLLKAALTSARPRELWAQVWDFDEENSGFRMFGPLMEMLCWLWVDLSETWKKVEGHRLKRPSKCSWNFALKKLSGLKKLLGTVMCKSRLFMCLFVSRITTKRLDGFQRRLAEGGGLQPSESTKWNDGLFAEKWVLFFLKTFPLTIRKGRALVFSVFRSTVTHFYLFIYFSWTAIKSWFVTAYFFVDARLFILLLISLFQHPCPTHTPLKSCSTNDRSVPH